MIIYFHSPTFLQFSPSICNNTIYIIISAIKLKMVVIFIFFIDDKVIFFALFFFYIITSLIVNFLSCCLHAVYCNLDFVRAFTRIFIVIVLLGRWIEIIRCIKLKFSAIIPTFVFISSIPFSNYRLIIDVRQWWLIIFFR